MHFDADRIERMLHGELDPRVEPALRAHLRACESCRLRFEEASREEARIFALLTELDDPVPLPTVDAIAARAGRGRWRGRRVAAGIALLLATSGLAYALPGSPLRDILAGRSIRTSRGDPTPVAAGVLTSGVAVLPGAEFTIVFVAAQEHGTALVRPVDSPELSVRALGDAVAFDLGADRLTIANRGATADYEILLPRAASSVRVWVEESEVLRWEDGRLQPAPGPGTPAAVRIRIGPSPSATSDSSGQ